MSQRPIHEVDGKEGLFEEARYGNNDLNIQHRLLHLTAVDRRTPDSWHGSIAEQSGFVSELLVSPGYTLDSNTTLQKVVSGKKYCPRCSSLLPA